jgi:hypothetical protein
MTKSKTPRASEVAQSPTKPPPAQPMRKTPRPDSKFAGVIALLEREGGATIADLQAMTGWQEHSVRGVLAGALKTRFGLNVTSKKSDGARVYRIAEASLPA